MIAIKKRKPKYAIIVFKCIVFILEVRGASGSSRNKLIKANVANLKADLTTCLRTYPQLREHIAKATSEFVP